MAAGVISKRMKIEDKEVEGRISELPDEIRIHILSFLPIKDAVKTMILSKQWLSTWTTVPNLNLELEDYKIPNFENFAERVISLHHGSINKFTMLCCRRHDSELVHRCISTAVMRNVSELNIRLFNFEYDLPDCIYTRGSLQVLEIHGGVTLKVPHNKVVALEHLKRLSLIEVIIEDDSYMTRVLSGCPVLEHLVIDHLRSQVLSTFSVISTSLKFLTMSTHYLFTTKNCSLSLYVPNLEYLETKPSRSIISAMLHIGFTDGRAYHCHIENSSFIPVVKLLNCFSRAITRIYLSYHTLKDIYSWLKKLHLTMFDKLKYLELEVKKSNAGSDYWSVVHFLLDHSPALTSLEFIGKGIKSYSKWYEPDTVAACLSSKLEILKVTGYFESEGEIRLLEYFVRNALLLKRMAISSYCATAERKESLFGTLSAFTWGSSTCQVTFY